MDLSWVKSCVAFGTGSGEREIELLHRLQPKLRSFGPAGPLLQSLHWLPIRQRINFKLAELCYLVTSFQQPDYLADLISPYS